MEDILGNGALIEAVKEADAQKAAAEIEAGADVNAAGSEQEWTALNFAAGKGDLAMVELLVKSGADVFKTGRDNRTPYKIAVAAGHAEVARFLADAEKAAGGDEQRISSRESETRPYCKAYQLKNLRRFSGWSEGKTNWKESDDAANGGESFSDEDIVFVHQDLTVTQSMFHNENVIMGNVTPEWTAFCTDDLGFKVPDDFDLMPSKEPSNTPQT